jgi:two-component system, LytTR family, sensor kinase
MGELLNLIGLSAGVVLYAMLLVMVARVGATPGGQRRVDPLLLLTSVLGLVWNLCALPVYELPKVGVEGPVPFLTAVGLGALGFLPAVVVHSVLRGEREGVQGTLRRALAITAYLVSAFAAALHLTLAFAGWAVPSVFGMRLLTYSFIAMVIPLARVTRGQPGSRRALWVAALAIFAVSALHLDQLHQGDASWPVELLGHHASLPLALAILYQDYPFALADLFLKRALALLAIVAVAFGGVAMFDAQSEFFAEFARLNPRQISVLVTLCVATALVYPSLRRLTAWFVDRIVLDRPNYPSLRAEVLRRLHHQDDVPTLLRDMCVALTPALSSTGVTWREWPATAADDVETPVIVSGNRATVIVPTVDAPRFAIEIDRLTGGRRFLSDDVATLDTIAVAVARRIDAIRLTRERYEREIREQEIGKLASEAELRALRAQVNPHFLFNALTTIGYLIQTAPPRALQTLMRLTALLRAVLRSEGEFTTLGRELEVVEAYLDIERERFEQRLRVTIDVPARLRHVRVPPFVIQPLVENAVKHGIAPTRLGGDVSVTAAIHESGASGRHLSIVVRDTGAGASAEALRRGRETGVGLRNVERRLACQYGQAASLSVRSAADEGTTVEIRLPVSLKSTELSDTDRVAV